MKVIISCSPGQNASKWAATHYYIFLSYDHDFLRLFINVYLHNIFNAGLLLLTEDFLHYSILQAKDLSTSSACVAR